MADTGEFGVSLGNGEMIKGIGVCKGVRIKFDGGLEIKKDFLPLNLGNADIIFSVQ